MRGERNYHIFYAMVAGVSKEERKALDLEDATKYNYLIGGSTTECEGRDEANVSTELLVGTYTFILWICRFHRSSVLFEQQ